MNYGLNISASGALVSMRRLDVAANNLANVETVSFKPDAVTVVRRDTATVEDGLGYLDSSALLERLGGGVLSGPSHAALTPAAPEDTGNPLDVAIIDDGFFVVDAGDTGDAESRRLTRDGRFALDARGRLVMSTTGLPALDKSGNHILLSPDAPAAIAPSGEVMQNGRAVATLQLVTVGDPATLIKDGANLYGPKPGARLNTASATPLLRAGAVERSGVDPINALMGVTDAGGAVRANLRMIQAHDDLMSRAINTFARLG